MKMMHRPCSSDSPRTFLAWSSLGKNWFNFPVAARRKWSAACKMFQIPVVCPIFFAHIWTDKTSNPLATSAKMITEYLQSLKKPFMVIVSSRIVSSCPSVNISRFEWLTTTRHIIIHLTVKCQCFRYSISILLLSKWWSSKTLGWAKGNCKMDISWQYNKNLGGKKDLRRSIKHVYQFAWMEWFEWMSLVTAPSSSGQDSECMLPCKQGSLFQFAQHSSHASGCL